MELEQRRHRGMALQQAGHAGNEVARMRDVTLGAVSQWKKKYQQDGPENLDTKP
jgi:transposase